MAEVNGDSQVLSEMKACLATIALQDFKYATCIVESGFLSEPNQFGSCTLQCTEKSSECCDVFTSFSACEVTDSTITEVVTCKDLLDTISNEALQCKIETVNILLITLCVVVVASTIAIHTMNQYAKKTLAKHQNVSNPSLQKYEAIIDQTRQVRNLLWKNFKLRLRHPFSLVIEQLLPLLLLGALVFIVNLDSLTGNSDGEKSFQAEFEPQFRRLQRQSGFCTFIESPEGGLGQPSLTAQSFYDNVQPVLGLFILLAFTKFISSLSSSMVIEKETRIRESMRLMGLNDSAFVFSWYLTFFLIFTPLAFSVSAELKYGEVFPMVNYATLFFFFWTFGWSMVSFCYMITPFFNKSKTVSVGSVLIWIVMFFVMFWVESKDRSAQYTAALIAPCAFGLGINTLSQQAQLGKGFNYAFAISTNPIEDVSVESMAWFLTLDTFLMLFLGWYFDKVVPQEFGVPMPWNFLFTEKYWTSSSSKRERGKAAAASSDVSADDHEPVVEPVDAILRQQEQEHECVQILGLHKEFPAQGDKQVKVAVKKLNLSFYSGQITALLGHNGAGKTTTINMLSGLYPASSGEATIFGRSLRTEMPEIRKSMGLCQQYDVLYDELTVKEHLTFFATMKSIPTKNVASEVRRKLKETGLGEKADVNTKSLSGGQKRKLSVAIALLGSSKMVILDEPTSGLDPYSRRSILSLLLSNRQYRTVEGKIQKRVLILTTHFLDEADLLGDRIAIMADGQLCCVGSSMFLKRHYGSGYNLTLVTASGFHLHGSDGDNVQDHRGVLSHIQSVIPEAKVASTFGAEVIIQLPVSASRHFPRILRDLDENLSTWCIQDYGISVTTLEAVFLSIARERERFQLPTENASSWRKSTIERHSSSMTMTVNAPRRKITLEPSAPEQFTALMKKRYQYAKRDKRGLCCSLGIPLFFLFILFLSPAIQVSQYLPLYKTNANAIRNAEVCRDSIAKLQSRDCALTGFSSFTDCNTICQDNRVQCSSEDCSGLNRYGDARPWCPGQEVFETHIGRAPQICESVWFSFCELNLMDCKAFDCCSSYNSKSPYYPCSTCANNHWPCYNNDCLRKSDVLIQGTINIYFAGLIVLLAFTFLPSSIIYYIVKEKNEHQNAKSQQLVSGMKIWPYWLSFYAWDLLTFTIPILVALSAIESVGSFRGDAESLFAAAVLMLLFAMAMIPLTYLFSFRYAEHSEAQTSVLIFNFVTGALLTTFSYISRLVTFDLVEDSLTLRELDSNYLRFVYLLFPPFALHDGLFQLGLRKYGNPYGSEFLPDSCREKTSCFDSNEPGCCSPQAFEINIAGRNMIILGLESLVFLVWVLVVDTKRSHPNRDSKSSSMTTNDRLAEQRYISQEEDSDVRQERVRVQGGYAAQDNLVMDSIRKTYVGKKGQVNKVALKNLTLAVPKGECFGYLGVNGAGM